MEKTMEKTIKKGSYYTKNAKREFVGGWV